MKFLKKLTPLILTVALLSSCKLAKEDISLRCVDQDTIIYNKQTDIQSYSVVMNLVQTGTDVRTFCEEFGLRYYKETEWMSYTTVETENGGMLVIFTGDSDRRPHCLPVMLTFSDDKNEAEIAKISAGMSLDDVSQADPEGQYPFRYMSWSGASQISYHAFSNGNYYMIHYDEHIVRSIDKFTI